MVFGWPAFIGAAAAGAYAATSLQISHIIDFFKAVNGAVTSFQVPGNLPDRFNTATAVNDQQVQILRSEVERLHQLLTTVVRNQKNASYSVVQEGRNTWLIMIYPTAIAGGLLITYARYRGWNFFGISPAALRQFQVLVTENFHKMWEELRRNKEEFVSKIIILGAKQEQLIQQQNAMDDKLRRVANNVENICENTNEINNRVGVLDDKMSRVEFSIEQANNGIYLLCAAVAEVSQQVNLTSSHTKALRTFVDAAPVGSLTSAGLRHLLENNVTLSSPEPAKSMNEGPSLASSTGVLFGSFRSSTRL